MWPITAVRFILMILVGILLFGVLIYMAGFRKSAGLKKRKKVTEKNDESKKDKIVLIYLILLTFLTTLSFIIINFSIRGAK